MVWDWLPEYLPRFAVGLWITIKLFTLSIFFGFLMAVPIGLVQVIGPKWLGLIARGFCTLFRGTPLLIQLWLLYYGLGSVFPYYPGLRESFIWPVLVEAFPYAIVAFSLSVAAYEGHVMKGAFQSVAKGELEAGRAFGMSSFTLLRRIWFPRAMQNILPTLAGEAVLTLKSVPLASTITIFGVYGVGSIVRQDTYRTYEPLLFVGFIYICFTAVIVLLMRWLESRVPSESQL